MPGSRRRCRAAADRAAGAAGGSAPAGLEAAGAVFDAALRKLLEFRDSGVSSAALPFPDAKDGGRFAPRVTDPDWPDVLVAVKNDSVWVDVACDVSPVLCDAALRWDAAAL